MDSPDPRGGVPLHEAAELLGVTVELLRKRAQRKTIPAYKVDGRWYVLLDGMPDVQDTTIPGPVQDRTGRPGQDDPHHAPSAVSPAARSQLEAIRDEWLAPLVERIGELEREAGRLQERVSGVERERDAITRERDDLASRLTADRELADRLVDVLQQERDAAVQERDRVAEVAGRDAAALRQVEERARALQADRDALAAQLRAREAAPRSADSGERARPLSGAQPPIGPPAWRTTERPEAERKPWWRVWWERWR